MKKEEILRQANIAKLQSLFKRSKLLRQKSRDASARLQEIKRQSDQLLHGGKPVAGGTTEEDNEH